MATFTNPTKDTSTITNASLGSNSLTWDLATFTWDQGAGTWDAPYAMTQPSRTTSTISNSTRN